MTAQLGYNKTYLQFKDAIEKNLQVLNSKHYYRHLNEWLGRLSQESPYHFSKTTLAAILSVASPRTNFNRLILALEELAYTGKIPAYLNIHRAKIEKLIRGDFTVLKGIKVIAFFEAILGDEMSIAVDVHILSYTDIKECRKLSQHNYNVISYTLCRLAAEYNVEPRELQANLWELARDRKRGKGYVSEIDFLLNR